MEKINCKSSGPVVHPSYYEDSLFMPDEYKADSEAVLNKLSVEDDFQGLKLYAPSEVIVPGPCLYIAGVVQVFVNCGSQLAIWANFPGDIMLQVLDNGHEYQSMDLSTMNVSYDQWTYERYSKMPCDVTVKEYFALDLYKYVNGLPFCNTTYQIQANFLGHELAEPLLIKVQTNTA